MTRIRREWQSAVLSLALVLAGVMGGLSLLPVNSVSGQGTANPKANPPKPNRAAAGVPEWTADIDDAIQCLEKSDYRKFLEQYAPVEILRRLRQQDLVERAATSLAAQPQANQQLLATLKVIRKQTPTFDKSRGIATFEFDPVANGVEEVAGELHLPVIDETKLVGLGGDLNKVLAEANRLLAAGEVQTFVERLFPASELARLKEPGVMQDLLQQFKSAAAKTPQSARPNPDGSPGLLEALQADFNKLQALKPELTEKGNLAVFRIEAKDRPVRVIKFQKAGSDWRLFDDVGRVTAELTRQSKLTPRSAVTKIQMELIGGNWRFIELPALQ